MKRGYLFVCFLIVFRSGLFYGQLSGSASVPGTYSSIAAALADLNGQGISGAFTLNIAANYSETAVTGGFTLSATGSPATPITIRKNGVGKNPLIIAYTGGNKTPGAATQDGIFRICGSDHVTIDGIDLSDPNTANPATMEFGYGLFKNDSADGCNHVCIRNCRITLSSLNNGGGAGPAADGSRGIDMVNAVAGAHNASVAVTSPGGSHSFNVFEFNTISHCNIGISMNGFNSPLSNYALDKGNEARFNAIEYFGGGGTANAATGIRILGQENVKITGNRLNNLPGPGTAHAATLRGIQVLGSVPGNAAITGNTITLHSGASSSQLVCVEHSAGSGSSSNTVALLNNVIIGSSYNGATSGSFYGLWNSADPNFLEIAGNTFINNSTGASSGSTYLIYNNGNVTSAAVTGNTLSFTYNGAQSYGGTMYGVHFSAAAPSATVAISRNVFRDINHLQQGTGNVYLVNNAAACDRLSIDSNRVHDLSLNQGSSFYCFNNAAPVAGLLSFRGNSITNVSRPSVTFDFYGIYGASSSPPTTTHVVSGNLISGFTSTVSGVGNFIGIYAGSGNNSPYPLKTIAGNTVTNVQMAGGGLFYGVYASDLGDGGGVSGSVVGNNLISDCVFRGNVHPLYCGLPTSPIYPATITGNTVQNIVNTSSTGATYGAYLSATGAGLDFRNNRVTAVTGTGTLANVAALYCSSTTTNNIFNNIIGSIEAPNSNGANRSNGIYITGGVVNAVYNSVYMNVVSTATNASSNALYCVSGATLFLANNILVNKSIPAGPGVAAAFRRSNSAIGTYDAASDHNLFYAGTPGSSRVVFYNGSSFSTLSGYQAHASPRDAASITLDPPFISIVPTSPNFLHLWNNLGTAIESGGITNSLADTDFDFQPRFGNSLYSGSGTAPDIGADEFENSLVPCTSAPATPSVSPATLSLCAGKAFSLSASANASGTGLLYEWNITQTSGTGYSITGSASHDYQSSPLPPGTYYVRFVATCTNSNQQSSSPESTITVVAQPSPVVGGPSAAVCEGDTVLLTAAGPTNAVYHWGVPGGFAAWGQQLALASVSQLSAGQYSVSATVSGCFGHSPPFTLTVSTVTLTAQPAKPFLCAGDTTLLQVTGSATSYSWSNASTGNTVIVSPAVSTVYIVNGTNLDGCSASGSVYVAVLDPTIAVVNASVCGAQSSATLSVNAFTPSVVSWYSDALGTMLLGTGKSFTIPATVNTTVYASAVGACSSSLVPAVLSVVAVPVLTAAVSPATVCAGKSTSIVVSGASSYSWTGIPGNTLAVVNPSAATQYTVKGTSATGCAGTLVVNIVPYPLPLVVVSPASVLVCPSAKTTLTAQGAESFTWNTGTTAQVVTVTPAAGTSYTVFGKSADGCINTATVAVSTKTLPLVTVTQDADSICPGEPVVLSAAGAVSYTWFPGFGNSPSYTVYPLVSSSFNAIGLGANSCTQVGFAYVEVMPCAVVSESGNNLIDVFPNPSDGEFHLTFSIAGSRRYQVSDLAGRIVLEQDCYGTTAKLDLRHVPPGLYLLKVSGGEGKTMFSLIRM